MSGALPSPFPSQNVLFEAASGQALQRGQRNALLMEQDRQTLGANEMEYMARASHGLLALGDEAKMAEQYPQVVAELQRYGFAKNAPSVFPGKATLERLALQGTSSEKLGEQRSVAGSVNAYGNTIGLNGSTPGAPGAPGATTTGATTPGPIEGDAQTRALAVRDGLIKRGMDFDTATAFAANALHESAANPNTGPGDRGASRGLFMWQGPRRQAYIEKYGHEPDNAPLDEQLDFVQHELGGSESLAQRRIAAAEGPEEKSRIVSRAYLRPKDEGPEMDRRGATARQLASLGPPQQPGAPGGGRVQVASVRPTQMEDGSPTPPTPGVQPPAQQQPGQQQTAATTPPVPQQPQQTPAATLPANLQTNAAGLTAQDVKELTDMRTAVRTPADFKQFQNEVQQRQVRNQTLQQQWQTRQETLSHQAQTTQLSQASGERDAERLRLAQEEAQRNAERAERDKKFAGAPSGYQWNADNTALVKSPGFEGTDKDERLTYRLENGDPNSPQYASDYAAKKWQLTQNGSYIENDMSMYPPPKHAVQRPTYVPQPTSAALDKVREVAVDADVITQNIDRYLDILKSTDGTTLSAFFNNPRDPKAQKLLGAFDAMRTSMRGPSAYNTGVLQPAEMGMLKEDLVSPQTVRGLGATPQAMEARLHEIKLSILRRADAELRSVGKDGVIMRNKKEADRLPPGAVFYDENGNKRQKPEAQ